MENDKLSKQEQEELDTSVELARALARAVIIHERLVKIAPTSVVEHHRREVARLQVEAAAHPLVNYLFDTAKQVEESRTAREDVLMSSYITRLKHKLEEAMHVRNTSDDEHYTTEDAEKILLDGLSDKALSALHQLLWDMREDIIDTPLPPLAVPQSVTPEIIRSHMPHNLN